MHGRILADAILKGWCTGEDRHEKNFCTNFVAAFLPSPLPRMQQAEVDVLKRLGNCICVIKLYFQIST